LVEDTVAMESKLLLARGHFVAYQHQTGIDNLGEPDVVLRQRIQFSSQLYPHIVFLFFADQLDFERLLLDDDWVDFHLSDASDHQAEFRELHELVSAEIGSVTTVVFNVLI
jgi:hypothetical protein